MTKGNLDVLYCLNGIIKKIDGKLSQEGCPLCKDSDVQNSVQNLKKLRDALSTESDLGYLKSSVDQVRELFEGKNQYSNNLKHVFDKFYNEVNLINNQNKGDDMDQNSTNSNAISGENILADDNQPPVEVPMQSATPGSRSGQINQRKESVSSVNELFGNNSNSSNDAVSDQSRSRTIPFPTDSTGLPFEQVPDSSNPWIVSEETSHETGEDVEQNAVSSGTVGDTQPNQGGGDSGQHSVESLSAIVSSEAPQTPDAESQAGGQGSRKRSFSHSSSGIESASSNSNNSSPVIVSTSISPVTPGANVHHELEGDRQDVEQNHNLKHVNQEEDSNKMRQPTPEKAEIEDVRTDDEVDQRTSISTTQQDAPEGGLTPTAEQLENVGQSTNVTQGQMLTSGANIASGGDKVMQDNKKQPNWVNNHKRKIMLGTVVLPLTGAVAVYALAHFNIIASATLTLLPTVSAIGAIAAALMTVFTLSVYDTYKLQPDKGKSVSGAIGTTLSEVFSCSGVDSARKNTV